MSSYQPQPFRVIRDQLLAFLVLQLLGSCTPITQLAATTPTDPGGLVVSEQVVPRCKKVDEYRLTNQLHNGFRLASRGQSMAP